MKTSYEWDRESYDEYGDIIDHHHSEKLEDVPSHLDLMDDRDTVTTRLVLVCTLWDGDEVDWRGWAYAEGPILPEKFHVPGLEGYEPSGYEVPKRFQEELAKS